MLTEEEVRIANISYAAGAAAKLMIDSGWTENQFMEMMHHS